MSILVGTNAATAASLISHEEAGLIRTPGLDGVLAAYGLAVAIETWRAAIAAQLIIERLEELAPGSTPEEWMLIWEPPPDIRVPKTWWQYNATPTPIVVFCDASATELRLLELDIEELKVRNPALFAKIEEQAGRSLR